MKKQEEVKINDNGSTTTIETIETTPEDGFVDNSVIRPAKMQHYGEGNTMYHKGYSKTVNYTTNDPRITRLFVYAICGTFLAIGIVMLLLKSWLFGIIFTVVALCAFSASKKDIDKVAEEIKQQGGDVTIDSKEEAEQLKNEVVGAIKDGMNDAVSSTFTKKNGKRFIKISLSIYAIVAIIVSILAFIFVNIILGVLIFTLLAIFGGIYSFILTKMFKHKKY